MKSPDQRLQFPDGSSASLWWLGMPLIHGEPAGCIGELSAPGQAAAQVLLEAACNVLASRGCSWAVGPMDGDTWHSYRLITESAGEPLFPGEPALSPQWAQWFEQSKFAVLAHYTSSRVALEVAEGGAPLHRAAQRLEAAGVKIRPLDPARWDEELERIHEVSLTAFRNAFLYAPLADDAFRALYEKARPLADPRWILIAECEGKPAGFVFAFRLPERPLLFVKTLAVVPERRFAGLGAVLLDNVQQAAMQAGCTGAIHCLQHEANSSLRVSSRYQPEVIRRYALFARRLNRECKP